MPAPESVLRLVERFDQQRDALRSPAYNETSLRREFLDPLFKALGWDVDNSQGHAEAYKEVVHEDAIKIGTANKAPDYSFRVGGVRKFFVEAKRPSVNIKVNAEAAYQLRRYAWSAKLPLSILTDFEELAVYDCRFKPGAGEKASSRRTLLLHYTELAGRWGELAGIFSREAILQGSFDKYAEGTAKRRGTATVDAEFLKDIERWREVLARNIALRNQRLNVRDLNFAVQRTIDRIIFLRIAEDRGLEEYGHLLALTNGTSTYRRLGELFVQADARYNSGLFHFRHERGRSEAPDDFTLDLVVDDRAIKDVLKALYYPESPYEFSVISADILGQVYEQFLGKVIRLTAGHQAKVEEKPEVRKAGGVYYTPTYIVDYIVKETLGKLLESKTPKQADGLRIVDPACGSGSFLIVAYQCLLDWYRDRYLEAGASKHRKQLFEGPGGAWRLTSRERKRILLNSIYGVDIDAQAVEVTKLSLLLKVLEGESSEHIQHELTAMRERALPDLGDNIKCGNSLIESDFYDQQEFGELTDADRLRINVFDWKAEFPNIFSSKKPGFDAVIGNPPYVLLEGEFRDERQLNYFRSRFTSLAYKIDTYQVFLACTEHLTAVDGRWAMIVPANVLTNNHLASLRSKLLGACGLVDAVVVDQRVFAGASVDSAILVGSASRIAQNNLSLSHAVSAGTALGITRRHEVNRKEILDSAGSLLTGGGSADVVLQSMATKSVELGSIAAVNFGKQLRNRKKYLSDVISVTSIRKVPPGYRACFTGRDLGRYEVEWGGLACLDDPVAQRGGCWDAAKQNAKGKLLTKQIGKWPEFALDVNGYQCLNTIFMVLPIAPGVSSLALLGLLNSRAIRFVWSTKYYDRRRTFPKIKGTYLKAIPIPKELLARPKTNDVSELERLVAARLDEVPKSATPAFISREHSRLEGKIDDLVFHFYGLTDDQIRIVEEATSGAA